MPRFFLLALSLFCACFALAQTKIPCDSPLTYIHRIGQADAHDRAYGICSSADGNLYLAGYQRDENFIAKITPIGKCLWLRKFSSTDAFGTGTPVQIMEDSDGNIVLCAAKGDSPTSWLSLVMRYDPKSNTILWAKQYKQNSPTARGILEKGAGGNFILHAHRFDGSGPVGKTRSELYELDRLTGEVLPNKAIEFRGDTHLVLSEMVYRDDALWVVGSTESDDRVQPAMGKISASLDSALWITSEEPDVSFFARNTFTFGSIISDEADFLIAGTGLKLSGGGLGVRLQKSDPSGAIIWAKNYEVLSENVVGRPYLVTTPNGYTMMLTLRGSRWILVNLDKNGAVLDHHLFTIKDDNAFLGAFSPRHKLLLNHKGYLLALDHTRPFQDEDIVLIRTTLDLEVEGNCVGTKTAQITWSSEMPITQPYSPVQVAISQNAEEMKVTLKDDVWENTRNICPLQLELGPDQRICPGDTLVLEAQPGFASYRWLGGPATRQYPVSKSGEYRIEAIDSCGTAFYDMVRVSVNVQPKRSIHKVLLPGESAIIEGKTYNKPAVIQSIKPSLTVGCDTLLTCYVYVDTLLCQNAKSFVKTAFFGSSTTIYNIIPAKDGNLYMLGIFNENQNHMLLKCDTSGNVLWAKHIHPFTGTKFMGFAKNMIEDSDGNIVICGNKTNATSYALKYSTKEHKILWLQEFQALGYSVIEGIIEMGTNGNYWIYTYLDPTMISPEYSEIWQLDRNTGNTVIPNRSWNYSPKVKFKRLLYHKGDVYAAGIFFDDNRQQNVFLLAKLDNTGNILWANTYPSEKELIVCDFIIGSDDFLLATLGTVQDTCFFLQKMTLEGEVIWRKKYKDAQAIPEEIFPVALCAVGENYMLNGRHPNAHFFTKISENGDVSWAVLDYNAYNPGKNFINQKNQIYYLSIYGNTEFGKLDLENKNNHCFNPFAITPLGDSKVGKTTFPLSLTTPLRTAYALTFDGVTDMNHRFYTNCISCRPNCSATPKLGPDQNICQNQTTTLDAGPGFASYKWSTGASTRTLLVKVPGSFSVEVVDSCGQTLRDTVKVSFSPVYNQFRNIPIFPGDTVVIAGVKYGQSATVVQKLKTKAGCDSTVTHNIFLIQSKVDLKCPADLSVTLAAGATTVKVDYDKVTASTDCPNPNLVYTRLQGPPSGGSFPLGTTTVCYRADNLCKVSNSCCFTVTVLNPELPCDAKNSPDCLRFELLETRFDAFGQRRYRIRVVNTCSVAVQYVYVQSPNGVNAVSPAGGSVYTTAPAGREYEVRNPNASPFPSIRFKARTSELKGGASDIFEQILPQQSEPAYLLIGARLENGAYYEAYLNTFNCPAQPYDGNRNREKDDMPEQRQPSPTLRIFPNPTTGVLYVNFPMEPNTGAMPERNSAANEAIKLLIVNSLGQIVFQQDYAPDDTNDRQIGITLERGLSDGMYLLSVIWPDGKRKSERFVLER